MLQSLKQTTRTHIDHVEDGMSLIELAKDASPEAVALAEEILRGDIENRAWAAQVGPCLTRSTVARLLGKSEQAVAQDGRLLSYRNGDGRIAYPVVQFDGPRPVAGLDTVMAVLTAGGDDDLTVLAWLTAPKPALDGRSPIDALRSGEVDLVMRLARAWAGDAPR
jgi:hypothetical protein